MSSDLPPGERLAGKATLVGGFPLEVYTYTDGTVTLWEPESSYGLTFEGDGLAELRELLDRAAMPGQPEAAPETGIYGCCSHCEHFGDENTDDHRQPCPEGCNELD